MAMEEDFFEESSSVPLDLRAGMQIGGKYELLRRVGAGAMGEVWAAKHLTLQEEVALKIVVRDVRHADGTSSDSRFSLEARIAAQLSRKTRHIVSVTDHGEDGPYAYLTMELLKGESLDARLDRTGPMPLAKVIPIIYQIARALSVAHADGVLHRDLKPTNVFVTVDEDNRAVIKILDFGIAKLRASMRKIPIDDKSKHTTLRGFLLGTPTFMSPEQARGRPIDHRTDVWALAVMAYHLLTKQFPFDGETPELLIADLCHGAAVPIQKWRPDLPHVVGDLFDRAFSERIDERFQSAVAFAGALEHLETLSRRLGEPSPMNAISIPPPAPMPTERLVVTAPILVPSLRPPPGRPPVSAAPPSPRKPAAASKKEGSSIIVARLVPRSRDLKNKITGAAIAVLVMLLFFGIFSQNQAKAPVAQAMVSAPTQPPPPSSREEIPPASAAALAPAPTSAEPRSSSVAKATHTRVLVPPASPVESVTPSPELASSPPGPPQPSGPSRHVDKSDVF